MRARISVVGLAVVIALSYQEVKPQGTTSYGGFDLEEDRNCSATRPCGSIGIGGCDAFMKFCSSSSGCKSRPAKGEPAQPVASLATVPEMASAMHRQANVRAVGLRPRNLCFPDAERAGIREGHTASLRPLGEEGGASGGVFDHSTYEEDGLVTWEALASPRRHQRCSGEPMTRLRRTIRLRTHVSSALRGTEQASATR